MALLSALATEIAIPVCAVIGIVFSLVLWRLRSCNDTVQGLNARQRGVQANCRDLSSAVDEGVKSFLCKEYWCVGAFVVAFAIIIFVCLGSVERFNTQTRPCKFDPSNTCKPALATAVFSTVSFLLGAFTSVVSGILGMKIAIYANASTALEEREFIRRTSIAASRSAAVMGFLLAAIGLLVLYLEIYLFKLYYGNDWDGLFEAITGYGLGGSSMALFGRTGGGIYAKAADVCHHLVQKIEPNIYQDYRNPAVIPNYVGDIVGNIAGLGHDLFASYANSSCAALVVVSISSFGTNRDFPAMCYPLLISSMGILVCLIATLMGQIKPGQIEPGQIERGWKTQLIISTILMTGGIFFVSWIALPSSFTIYNFGSQKVVKSWQLSLCVGVGLWAGLIIGFVNKIYTNSWVPNAARNGVSVSLASVTLPCFAAVSIFVSLSFAATYGIAVAALGMLSNVATRLVIDAYGPISHNAGDIAVAAGAIFEIGALDAAGNAATAIGKGFAIESAALVSIALLGAFVNRAAISPGGVVTSKIIMGLTLGYWLPRYFSAMTMKSVGRAVVKMVPRVREKLRNGLDRLPAKITPHYYAPLFRILTDASVDGVILPGGLVMLTPLIVGTVFGVEMLSGVLAGSLSYVVKIAISASNADEPWKKVNVHVKVGASGEMDEIVERSIDDSQKDTSGPPLNILIQLMAVECLVFAPFFAAYGGLLFKILGGWGTEDFPFVAAASAASFPFA